MPSDTSSVSGAPALEAAPSFFTSRPNPPSESNAPTGGGHGVSTTVTQKQSTNRNMSARSQRLYAYDVEAAKAATAIESHVQKEDRMSWEEAIIIKDKMHVAAGIIKKPVAVRLAFDRALFLYHALNGASSVGNGSGRITVAGQVDVRYADVIAFTNGHARRFFRAYADEVRAALVYFLAIESAVDADSVDRACWIREVAYNRGMGMFPDLIADSADACQLSPGERLALISSKASVLEKSGANVGVTTRERSAQINNMASN